MIVIALTIATLAAWSLFLLAAYLLDTRTTPPPVGEGAP